jgi:hypothetical protein
MHAPPRTRRAALRQSRTRYIGLDVHQDSSAVASVAQEHGAEVIDRGAIGPRQCDIAQLIRTLPSQAPHQRNQSSFKKRSEPSTHTPIASSVSHKTSKLTCKPGV